ncbi:hypothetical protein NL676_015642 [Syzygium grande]|nr:hypothetical protein NL676_015642 [Syzygium grande]
MWRHDLHGRSSPVGGVGGGGESKEGTGGADGGADVGGGGELIGTIQQEFLSGGGSVHVMGLPGGGAS